MLRPFRRHAGDWRPRARQVRSVGDRYGLVVSQLASIRGWIEGYRTAGPAIRNVIERYREEHSAGSAGWQLGATAGYTKFWFYGAAMNHPRLTDWLRPQLQEIAALPLAETEEPIRGFFLVTSDVAPTVEWHIRNGELVEMVHDGHLRFLDE